MDWVLSLAFLFCIGGFLGWCLEVLYRRLDHGKWMNPGFLTGPVLPLYGTGLVLMYLICLLCEDLRTGRAWLDAILPLLIIVVAMTTMEYLTGLALLKLLNLRLWDYTENFGNLQGIICPLYTFFWALCGAGYRFLLHGVMRTWVAWYGGHGALSFLLGVFYGVFLVDLACSFQLATKIRSWAAHSGIIIRYEKLKELLYDHARQSKEKVGFFVSLYAPRRLQEIFDAYLKARQTDGERVRRFFRRKK